MDGAFGAGRFGFLEWAAPETFSSVIDHFLANRTKPAFWRIMLLMAKDIGHFLYGLKFSGKTGMTNFQDMHKPHSTEMIINDTATCACEQGISGIQFTIFWFVSFMLLFIGFSLS